MGLMDKVKATAGKAAEKAQQGVSQGITQAQEKLSEVQERRKLDAVLRELGTAVYLDRAGRGSPAITADIERLLAEVRDLEAAGTLVTAATDGTPSAPEPAAEPVPQEPVPEGSYKLEDV